MGSCRARHSSSREWLATAVFSRRRLSLRSTRTWSSPAGRASSADRQEELRHRALKKLINGEVRSRSKANVTQSKAFTERLEAAIARYHNNALTTAQVLEELIQPAKDIRAAHARGQESGLTDDEIAFYDALAENESARQVMGEPVLRVIAHELVAVIRGNVSVDWMHRDSARADFRRHVKRLLRKYGYPPDLQDAAVHKVQQAEALSA